MPESIQTFSELQLAPQIQSAIAKMGYVKPTPIQVKAIPLVLEGRDVMGAAQTGTGKTAGYGLPAIHRVVKHANTSASPARHPVRVLVITPTRELADQVNDNLTAYASETTLRVAAVYGGVDMKPQVEALRRGVEILTATPGRLLDHVEGKSVTLSQVEVVILDEADRMLDMGFLPDISRILNLLPKKRQSLMFSATFSPEIKKLAQNFLNDPVIVEVARQNATADTVKQIVYSVNDFEKGRALTEILQTGGEDETPLKQVIVFVNAKITCRRLTRMLVRDGIKADAIHGDKTQDERSAALEAFKKGECEVLVATDVAARGLDIAELPTVINYDVPYTAEDYVHRIGRTGRAGAKGQAIMLTTSNDAKLVDAIEKLIKQKFTPEVFTPTRQTHPSHNRRNHQPDWKNDDNNYRKRSLTPAYRQFKPDPIFDTPYEPSGYAPSEQESARVTRATTHKKKRPVAALLGGFRR